jgi:hypothetical protein
LRKILNEDIMDTTVLLDHIYHLPIRERMLIAEHIIHSIRIENSELELEKSVEIMADEYRNDKELTIFTQLDSEDFYETW